MKNKKNLYLMYALALLQGMVFYGPIATLYRQARGLTVFQITLIESVSYLLCILFEIPWGMFADKIGYKKTMCFCCGLYFVSKLVFLSANGFFPFLLERIMLSVVLAGFSGVDTSILYLSCNKGESQKVFGVYDAMGLIGLLFASLIFSVFIGNDYSMAALLTAIAYGLAAVLSLFLNELKSAENQAVCLSDLKAVFIRIIRDQKGMLFLISVAFLSQTHQSVSVFLNQIQYERCAMSASAIGYVYIGVTLAGLSGLFSAKLTRRIGEKRVGTAFFLAAIAACIALGFTGRAQVSVLSVLLLNAANSLYQPYQTELQNRRVQSADRATELSVYAMVIDCVSAGTSVLFGALANVCLKAAFFFGAGISFLGLLFWLRAFYGAPFSRFRASERGK